MQNPEFGFYFLRLASARLFQNLATLEQRLMQHERSGRCRAEVRLTGGDIRSGQRSLLASLLLADIIGDDDVPPPRCRTICPPSWCPRSTQASSG